MADFFFRYIFIIEVGTYLTVPTILCVDYRYLLPNYAYFTYVWSEEENILFTYHLLEFNGIILIRYLVISYVKNPIVICLFFR